MQDVEFLTPSSGDRLAFRRFTPPRDQDARTGFLWLGGFKSDMAGTKATALYDHAARTGRPCVLFDYSGHGRSEGRLEDLTLSRWLADTGEAFASLTTGRTILLGSSMGGHLALLLVRKLATEPQALGRIAGLLLIAPAANMTELIWAQASEEGRRTIIKEGVWLQPSAYGDPYPITGKLIEDGRRHLILDQGIEVSCPVRILHGEEDADVPWQHGRRLYRALRGEDVQFTLIKGGDHRLSSPRDIRTILEAAESLAALADGDQ